MALQINELATETVHIVLMHGQICSHYKHQSIFFYLKRRTLYTSKEMLLFIISDYKEIISAGGGGDQFYNFCLIY